MTQKNDQSLYYVKSLKSPGPKWHTVSDPVTRTEAAPIVEGQWKQGHYTRLFPAEEPAKQKTGVK